MRRAARLAYRAIGPVLFLALVWMTDLTQVRQVWEGGSPWLLAAAAGLNAAIIVVKAWRWRSLMRLQGIPHRYAPAVRYYTISCALAAWTPGRLGDFSKALAVQRDWKVGLGRAASSVIADRLLDAVVLAAIAAAGAALLPGPNAIWLTAAGLVVAAVAAWFLFRSTRTGAGRRGAERLVERFGPIGGMGARAGEEVGAALDGLVDLARPGLGPAAVATLVATLLTFLQGSLVARSLGLDIGFWTLSAALAGVSIASLLPVTVAGFGTREGMLLMYLGPLGVRSHEVIAFSLAYFLVISGSLALMGAAAWVIKPARAARGRLEGEAVVVRSEP